MSSHRLAASIALCALAACSTTGGKHLGYGLGGVFVLGGGIGVARAATDNCDKVGCGFDAGLGTVMVVAGLVTIGIAAMSHVDPEPPLAPVRRSATGSPAPEPAVVTVSAVPDYASVGEPPTSSPELRRLTLQARVAARRGQCPAVVAIAAQVEEIDRAYRREGFVADVPVAACLR